jgi:hypothetical protein
VTSTGYTAPYLNVAGAQKGAALVFFDRELSPTLHFYSFNIVSNRQTSIQSIEWTPRKNLHLAASAGIGSNQKYGAASLEYDRSWIKLLAGYVESGRAFQRIRVDNPILSETDRENIRLELIPRHWLHLSYDRENYVSPDTKGLFPRARVNGYGAFVTAAGFIFHGDLFDSQTGAGNSRAMSGGVRRNFKNWLDLSEDYFRSVQEKGQLSQALVTTVREKITRRIWLSQYINRGNGQTSISYGGTFFSNRFSFGVDYQTVYLPLVAGAQSQFKQVLVANVRLLLPHTIELNGMTDVDPAGKVRYTGYFSSFLYHGLGASAPGAPAAGPGMHAYVVRGRIVDQNGEPVRGAAVRVQGEIAFTNSEGEFELRRRHAEECAFEVALNDFMVAGRYEVVQAPKKVKSVREEMATVEEIIVRRLPTIPKRSEANPESVPGAEPGSQIGSAAMPSNQQEPVSPASSTPLPVASKLHYNQSNGSEDAGSSKTSGIVAGGVHSGSGSEAPLAARPAVAAPGNGAAGGAVAAGGWSVLDSSGPESSRSAKRDSECFGLAKQLGACTGPVRKLRVQARGKLSGHSAAHRAAQGRRPAPTASADGLSSSAGHDPSVASPGIHSAAGPAPAR